MANQLNPNLFALMCRCDLADAAIIFFRAKDEGVAVNKYLGRLIHEHVKNEKVSAEMQEWINAHYSMNLKRRRIADEKTAAGKYRTKNPKKRGRPIKSSV